MGDVQRTREIRDTTTEGGWYPRSQVLRRNKLWLLQRQQPPLSLPKTLYSSFLYSTPPLPWKPLFPLLIMSSECTHPTHCSKDGPWPASVNRHLGQSDWLVRGWGWSTFTSHSKDNGKQRAICWGFWEKCTRSIFPGRFNGLMWGYEVWNGLQILPWEGQV